jgi:hypothetical protein
MEVGERIDAARGGPLTDEAGVMFEADVSEDQPGQLKLTVRTRVLEGGAGAPQTRTLSATDCEELVTAFVQIVSLALGPYVTPENSQPNQEANVESVEPPPPAVAAAEKPRGTGGSDDDARSAPSLPQEETLRLSAFALLDTASLGDLSVGPQLGVGLALRKGFELRGVVGYVPPHAMRAERDNTSAGGRFSLAFGGVLGCSMSVKGPFRGNFCAGIEAGNLSAAGVGVSAPKSDHVLWLAARGDIVLGVQVLPGLRTLVLCSLVFPVLHHEFSLSGVPLHKIPGSVPRAGLGLEYGL